MNSSFCHCEAWCYRFWLSFARFTVEMVILYQFVGVVGTAFIVVGIACGSNSLKFDIRPVVGITMFSFYYGAPCNKSLQCGNIMARKQIALNIFSFIVSAIIQCVRIYIDMTHRSLLNLCALAFISISFRFLFCFPTFFFRCGI